MSAESSAIDPAAWCGLSFPERRQLLAEGLSRRLGESPAIQDVVVEAGPPGREHDFTAMVQTDVGRLRTPLWSHAQAMIFCDPSVHPANRAQIGPEKALDQAAERLRARLEVRYTLESRGLTFELPLEPGASRTWTAEHALFRKRTAVTREDRVERAGDVDVRDLLAHFYDGPSLRLVADSGEAFLLPAQTAAEGPAVTLCHGCGRWSEEVLAACPHCGSDAVDQVIAARFPKR